MEHDFVPGHTAKASIKRHPTDAESVGERYEKKILEKGIEPTTTGIHEAYLPHEPVISSAPPPETTGETQRKLGLQNEEKILQHRVERAEKEIPDLPPETTGDKILRKLGLKDEEHILRERMEKQEAARIQAEMVNADDQFVIPAEGSDTTGTAKRKSIEKAIMRERAATEKPIYHTAPTITRGIPQETFGEKIQRKLGMKTDEALRERTERDREAGKISEPAALVVPTSTTQLPPETTAEKIQKVLGLKSEEEILLRRGARVEREEEQREMSGATQIVGPGEPVTEIHPKETEQRKVGTKSEPERQEIANEPKYEGKAGPARNETPVETPPHEPGLNDERKENLDLIRESQPEISPVITPTPHVTPNASPMGRTSPQPISSPTTLDADYPQESSSHYQAPTSFEVHAEHPSSAPISTCTEPTQVEVVIHPEVAKGVHVEAHEIAAGGVSRHTEVHKHSQPDSSEHMMKHEKNIHKSTSTPTSHTTGIHMIQK